MNNGKKTILKLSLWIGETGSWTWAVRSRSGAVVGISGHGKTPAEAKEDFSRKTIMAIRKELNGCKPKNQECDTRPQAATAMTGSSKATSKAMDLAATPSEKHQSKPISTGTTNEAPA